MRSRITIILTFIYAVCAQAQSNIHINHYSKGYGLNYRWVYDITQDENGFMWFANHTGLRRYDGRDFITYHHSKNDSTTLSTNTIKRVTTDSQGNIWAYGNDQVFNKLDLKTGKINRIKHFYKNNQLFDEALVGMKHFGSLKNGDFIAIFQQQNTLGHVGECTVWKFNVEKNAFEYLLDIPTQGRAIDYFTEQSDGKIWLWGMADGYFLVDLNQKKLQHFQVPTSEMMDVDYSKVPVDGKRNFWYPSSSNSFDKNQPLESFEIPNEIDPLKIDRITLDNIGNIWFYHDHDELFRFEIKSGILEKFIDPIFQKRNGVQIMYHYFEDKEGNVWNGHFVGAIAFKKQAHLFKKYFHQGKNDAKNNSQSFSARNILELSPNKLLVKDNDQELFILDLNTEAIKKISLKNSKSLGENSSLELNSIILGKDGHAWANSMNQVLQIDLETGGTKFFDVRPKQLIEGAKEEAFKRYWPRIFEDSTENLWWCDLEGIYLFDKNTKKLKQVKLRKLSNSAQVDFKYGSYDAKNDAIYGTYNKGIYQINCKDKSATFLEIFTENEGYDVLITSILNWKKEFWLSTNKGLIRFDPKSKKRIIYNRQNGLPSNLVYSTLGSESHLWLGTQNGLCQFNPNNLQAVNYFKEHGLADNSFNIWSAKKTADGKMFIGGPNGIIGFDPTEFKTSLEKKGALNIVEISKYHKKKNKESSAQNLPYVNQEKLIVNPHERTITFKYTLSLYDAENSHQYAYYMEGLDKGWIKNGNQNEAHYVEIPPGEYTFHAKAIGPQNTAALNEISIPVTVKQYWYLRPGTLLIYLIIMTSSIFILYKYQLQRKLKLQEADKIRELDEVKTKMYTNITHEFRTPLTVILGMNELVKDSSETGDLDKMTHANEMIDRNGKNLLNLVNQMLELSKLESGQLQVNKEQSNIVDYLKYRLESFQSYAAEKHIHIEFLAESDEIIMDFDVDKISYIIGNLVSNAIKFTPENGLIQVFLNVFQNEDQNSFIELKVKDTGIGIKANQLNHIFNRFYQVDDSHTRKGEGTGIGLSLVNELVKLLNGTIHVKSKINEGSEFMIHLPVTNEAILSDALETHISNEWSGSLYNIDLTKEYSFDKDSSFPLVLIVEDNLDVSHYISLSLKDQYRIVTAKNGKEGIEKAISLIPDIIISDVMMPIKDGFELCETVKQDERTSHIPVILLTGKSDIDSKIEGLKHGADVYLSKPFNKKELLIRIKNLMVFRAEIQRRYSESNLNQVIADLPTIENSFLVKIRMIILEHIESDDFNIQQLCQLMFMSRSQLHRKLIALTGESTSHLIRKIQLEKAEELLLSGEYNVSEVAYQVGFKTQAHFSRIFAEKFGYPPSNLLKNQ